MPSFRTGTVVAIREERDGLQRVDVDISGAVERAYVLTRLTGTVEPGDPVVVNTTAVELGLGTGGWHVVHWNLRRRGWTEAGPGHIMKSRYTSFQHDAGSTEEHSRELVDLTSIDGMPVVAAPLHSQLPAVAAGFKARRPTARLAYVMTDGAALPLALSDLVVATRRAGLVDFTVTCGHAFGGDYEAVSVFSALVVARHLGGADAAIVAMGPGIVGTDSRLGFSGIEVGPVLDAAAGLDGRPVAALRVSFADPRERHRGVSHHTLTALTLATRSRVRVPVPTVGGDAEVSIRRDLDEAGINDRHDVVGVAPVGAVSLLRQHDLTVTSMGRPAEQDPVLFEAAAAAGVLAADLLP